MKILITGCAGFIGFHLCVNLLKDKKNKVFGLDNINKYYDVKLKKIRLNQLISSQNFKFYKINICNKRILSENFKKNNYNIVVHLAAQAGIRYSLKNPDTYIRNNIVGFHNVINYSQRNKVKHFIFASSSSVYGENNKFPLKEIYKTDHPLSIYAATKKSNEVSAYSFSNLYKIPVTGLRFFTVYGPFGRPDMAIYSFVESILNNRKIFLFNKGNNYRDFTYIDDAINCVKKIIYKPPRSKIPFVIYNIGSDHTVKTSKLLNIISKNLKIKPKIKYVESVRGDVIKTHANIDEIYKKISYKPKVSIELGIKNFIEWYKSQIFSFKK